MAAPGKILDTYFKISERGSTISTEIRGGVVTFVAMAYIVVLNPLILGSFSADDAAAKTDVLGNILPVNQVAAVTALVAGALCGAYRCRRIANAGAAAATSAAGHSGACAVRPQDGCKRVGIDDE